MIEREAARRGGGRLVAPVQRVTDFLAGVSPSSSSSQPLPSSSYRCGVVEAACHEIYPAFVTQVSQVEFQGILSWNLVIYS